MYKQLKLKAVKGRMLNTLSALVAAAGLLAGTSASAAMLNLDFIDNPDIYSSGITVSYDALNDTLSAEGYASTFTDLSGTQRDIANGTLGTFSLSAIIDDAGNFSGGNFTIGGTVGSFNSGTLLSGDLTAFGFESGNPSFEFALNVTGGDAMSLYGNAGLTLSGMNTATSFAADFVRDFAYSDAKTVVPAAVVPVPAAAWLFGSGLIGLVGVARRRSSL